MSRAEKEIALYLAKITLFGHIARFVARDDWQANDIADAVDQIMDRWMPVKPGSRNAKGQFASPVSAQAARDEAVHARQKPPISLNSFSNGLGR